MSGVISKVSSVRRQQLPSKWIVVPSSSTVTSAETSWSEYEIVEIWVKSRELLSPTWIVTELLPAWPALSVTVAVMVWKPAESRAVLKLPPEPIVPSIFEVQESWPVKSPSSLSLADPLKVIDSDSANWAPLTGSLIETTGAWSAATSLTCTFRKRLLALAGEASWSLTNTRYIPVPV